MKIKTIKPTPTLIPISLIAGVSPGIHPVFSPMYIRRIKIKNENTKRFKP